jgi:cation transport ATPase
MHQPVLESKGSALREKRKILPSPAPDERSTEQHPLADAQPETHCVEALDLLRIALVGVGVLVSWVRLWEPVPNVDVIGLGTTLVGGYPIFREAVEDIRSRRMTMELSMTIALCAALAIREFFTAALIVFFVLIAEVLEELTVGRGRKAIRDLVAGGMNAALQWNRMQNSANAHTLQVFQGLVLNWRRQVQIPDFGAASLIPLSQTPHKPTVGLFPKFHF